MRDAPRLAENRSQIAGNLLKPSQRKRHRPQVSRSGCSGSRRSHRSSTLSDPPLSHYINTPVGTRLSQNQWASRNKIHGYATQALQRVRYTPYITHTTRGRWRSWREPLRIGRVWGRVDWTTWRSSGGCQIVEDLWDRWLWKNAEGEYHLDYVSEIFLIVWP